MKEKEIRMKFFQERKRKKQLAELKSRRHAEDDLLSPALCAQFDGVIAELQSAPVENIDSALAKARKEYAALPLPRRSKLYGFLDLVVVVGLVAFGLRGLFFQPFKIPTGSMQPTLFGVHHQRVEDNANPGFGKIPGILHNIIFGTTGVFLKHSGQGGRFGGEFSRINGLIFDCSQFAIGSNRYVLPGNPAQVVDYSNLYRDDLKNTENAYPEIGNYGKYFTDGDIISDGYMTVGDHLFVERVSMYLSPPARGDIIVFNTENLSCNGVMLAETGGYYYIKRLAALPGDTVKIIADQLYIRPAGDDEFQRIQDIVPAFEKVYSGRGGYHGHRSGMGSMPFVFGSEYVVPENSYLMLGDNSSFSMDSRYFGPVPRKNLIGRAWLVFYPFSRRMGLVDRNEPLEQKTGKPGESAFPEMALQ